MGATVSVSIGSTTSVSVKIAVNVLVGNKNAAAVWVDAMACITSIVGGGVGDGGMPHARITNKHTKAITSFFISSLL